MEVTIPGPCADADMVTPWEEGPTPVQRKDEQGDIAVPCSGMLHLSKYIPARRKRSNAPESGKVGWKALRSGTVDRWLLVRVILDVATRSEQARLMFVSTKKRRDSGTLSAQVKGKHQ